LALGGTVLLWLSAKIQIPLYPVPVTMQTLVVLVLGVAYGWRLGVATMALYLWKAPSACRSSPAAGARAPASTILYGPTAGYLFGFVVAAGICGRLPSAAGIAASGRRPGPWSSAISSSTPWASPGSPFRSARPMRSNTA
jgi:Uncharacterized conserved protein